MSTPEVIRVIGGDGRSDGVVRSLDDMAGGVVAAVLDASGEARAVELPEVMASTGPAAAADEARVAAAVDATPPPPDARSAAREGALLASARAMVVGWRARCEGRPAPAPDPLDPTASVVRAGWSLCDVAIASGIDPRTTSPVAVGEELARRVTILVQAAHESKGMHDALDVAIDCIRYYERDAWQPARASGRVLPSDDDGRRATMTIGDLRQRGIVR